jgi:hypothetical protein
MDLMIIGMVRVLLLTKLLLMSTHHLLQILIGGSLNIILGSYHQRLQLVNLRD